MKTKRIAVALLLIVFLLTGCIFTQKPKEFKLLQDEKNITEISRVFVTWDQNNQMSMEIKETVSGEQLASALQGSSQIKYADGSYQLLDLYCNEFYESDGSSELQEYLEFDETQFLSLWNQGFGGTDSK